MSKYSDFAIQGCAYCAHLYSWGITCKAYPKGIPLFIASGEVSHETPLSGDHGIQFEWSDAILPEDQPRYPPGDPLGRGGRYIDPNGIGEPINMFETLDMPSPQTSEYEEYMDRVKAEEPDNWSGLTEAAVMRASDWQYAIDDVADDLYPDNPSSFWAEHIDFAKWFLTVPSFDAMSALRATDMVKDLFDQYLITWNDLAQADPILVTSLLMEDFDYWSAAATWSGEQADVLGYLAVFGYTLQDMVQPDYPGRDIWALMIEDSQQNEFLPFLALMPDPVSFIKAMERDISHVLRDEHGRWTNTPNAGDDAPDSDEVSSEYVHPYDRAKYANIREDFLEWHDERSGELETLKAEEARQIKAFEDWRAEITDAGGDEYPPEQYDKFINDIRDTTEQMNEKASELRMKTFHYFDQENPSTLERVMPEGFKIKPWVHEHEIAEEGVGMFNRLVDRSVTEGIPQDVEIEVEFFTTYGASFDPKTGKVKMVSSQTGPMAILHELGHWAEFNDSAIEKASLAYREYRADGAEPEKFNKFSDIFSDDVMGYSDDFKLFYTGRIYGETNGHIGTEIVSTGLEFMLDQPASFARDDPDHFDFTLAFMNGELSSKPSKSSKSTKTHHWEQVVRDEMGRWANTPGSGMEDPTRPTGAPKWATDGRGRKVSQRELDAFNFAERAHSVSMQSDYDDSLDDAPDVQKLIAGDWNNLGFGPTSYGIWKVTDEDGKEWFVKRMLDMEFMEGQSLKERDAGYMGRALGINVVPLTTIDVGEFGAFLPPGDTNDNSPDTQLYNIKGPSSEYLVSPFLDMKTGWDLSGKERKTWRSKLPVDTRIKALLFDITVNNTDRHPGNYGMMGLDQNLTLIDHGMSFGRSSNPRLAWVSEMPSDTIFDRSYLLWMRGAIEKASPNMLPAHEKFVKQRYNQVKKWWEKNSAGERGYTSVGAFKRAGFYTPADYR